MENMVSHSAQFWRDRSVFVTGAMGLVGSATVKKLVDLGASVVILQRDWIPDAELVQSGLANSVSIVRGDLTDIAVLERVLGEFEVATVLHLAAQAVVGVANKNPLSTFESNIKGTWNLLEACRRSLLVKQIVVASSDKAYGEQPSLPYTEDMPLLAKHPYDVSKACTDMLAQSYAHSFDLPVTISRCGNFYGPGDLNWNRIVPGTIRSLLKNERPVVRSDGSFVRDYLYVEDGADAYLTLAEKMAEDQTLKGEVFNFSTEEPMTVLEIVEKITQLMGSDLSADIKNEASNEILQQHLSAKKAKKMLGWSAAYGLEEGLKKTIEWYRHFQG